MRITVLMVGGLKRSTKMFSIPGFAVVGLGVWLGLSFLLGALACFLYADGQRLLAVNKKLRGDLSDRQAQIKAKDANLLDHRNKIDELNIRFMNIKVQLDAIREFDSKIREYLGLEVQDFSEEQDLHQGGMPPYSGPLSEDQTDSGDLSPNPSGTDPLLLYASFVSGQQEEVADFLKDQEDRFTHLPSILPVKDEGLWVSSTYGWRSDPFTGRKAFHEGLDIAGQLNSVVIAPADGKVTEASRDRFLGKMIRIDHGSGIETLFGHLNRFNVKKGEHVKRGQVIGYMGNTGRSTGTHLHYGVEKNRRHVDPVDFIWDYRVGNRSLAAVHHIIEP